MEIQPFDKVGIRGRDFVISDENELPKFEARQLEGSKTLKVGWTDNFPWTPYRLREVQRLAGGQGSIETIEGFATDEFGIAINEGVIDEDKIEHHLNRNLRGRWSVTISRISNGWINILANRLGD
jgi:hypothetical protein